MSKTIFKLIDDLLDADYFGERNIATYNLTKGIEAYANQRVIDELEKQMELAQIGNSYTKLRERIQELKQD